MEGIMGIILIWLGVAWLALLLTKQQPERLTYGYVQRIIGAVALIMLGITLLCGL